MKKVVGFEIRRGTYEGHDYDNCNLHCTTSFEGSSGVGVRTEVIKVKNSVLAFLKLNPSDMVNKNIDVYFDRYGRVDMIIVK